MLYSLEIGIYSGQAEGGAHNEKSSFEDNLWKYIFPILSIVLWIIAAVLFVKSHRSYSTTDYEAQLEIMSAMQWYPACFIGAIIPTAAAYVVSELRRHIDK